VEAQDYIPHELPAEYAEKLRQMGVDEEEANQILAELGLRLDLQNMLQEYMAKLESGQETEISLEELHRRMNEIAREKYGWEYGVPLPSLTDVSRPLIMAKGAPFSRTRLNDGMNEFAQELILKSRHVINSWTRLADVEVCMVRTTNGPYSIQRWMAGTRMRKFMDTILMRSGAQSAERELKAMESLKKRIGTGPWDSYVLNGAFAERSPRSDLHYIFRKGLPTMVLSYHGKYEEQGGRVLACLCLHPLGYYFGTYCGLMCPTDEVICHLLMMRGDEHKYWASCGQWPAFDVRSGL
jgi:hypothetical protein